MRLSKEDWKAKKDAEKKALENKLDSFLKDALNSKENIDKLTAHYRISGLYGYSFYNSLLIKLQGGTVAQSFNKWKKLERIVNKGEKSHIDVFCPMFKKENKGTEDEKEVLVGFKLVPVFDIEQTSGKELEYDHNSEDGQVDYTKVKAVMEKLTGSPVEEEYTGSARGYSNGKKNVVSKMSNDTDKVKTLIHEVGHHFLHTSKEADRGDLNHSACEVEAESVAYLVLSYLGVDYELTQAYVSGYKSGISNIRSGKVIKVADKIIKALK